MLGYRTKEYTGDVMMRDPSRPRGRDMLLFSKTISCLNRDVFEKALSEYKKYLVKAYNLKEG